MKTLSIGNSELNFYNIISAAFSVEMIERDYKHFRGDAYPAKEITDMSKVAKTWKKNEYDTYYFDDGETSATVQFSYGNVTINVGGRDQEAVKNFLTYLQSIVPRFESEDPAEIQVNFWSDGANGPTAINRTLTVDSWETIYDNYTKDTRSLLDEMLVKEYRPGRGGQLYLWYGEPGTGKTTALRALARLWKPWCDMHYITDPERFFGSNANYMLQVMLDESDRSDKWRCLILEDCGELISADAKMTNGQGLSRFLNSVDGLIGQGLRFVVLVTTNEPLKKLHPAVARPGRCAAQIEFKELSQEEVERWAQINKLDIDTDEPLPKNISELYALVEGRKAKVQRRDNKTIGFVTAAA